MKLPFPKTIELLDQARNTVFPDYGVGVFYKGEKYFHYAGCGEESLFDLASVSKVVCTTSLCAIAEDKKIFSIDQSLKEFFPDFKDSRVKLSHLLNHTSGFPAWLALHALFHDEKGLGAFNPQTTPPLARARYEKEIIQSWTAENFEKQAVYSDLGFMLLGWILEKKTKTSLDALFQDWIALPAGLESLQFLPISPDVVPTEDCPWRGHVLRGEVHDDNCYVLGGVAGHAGLFGNVRDVLEFGKIWLDAFVSPKEAVGRARLIKPATIKKYFTFSHVPTSSRLLGWDGITVGQSSTGKYFSPTSRGHTGYTGTSLWIDPEQKLIVTLLTNRVHPTRENDKIKAFRPIFHDSLFKEMIELKQGGGGAGL